MALFEWNDSYSVNVSEIDEQHKRIVAYINELNDAMGAGKGKDALGTILAGLIDYTATHFATEEKYFERFNYIGAIKHKGEHKALVSKVTDLKAKFDAGSMSLSIETMNFLKDWLTTHIAGSDKMYTACFNENGLQ